MDRGDLTNNQWARLEPLLPHGIKPGRPPVWTRRQLIDGIRWRTQTGAPWRDVPERYGPGDRGYDLFRRWQRDGTWARIVTQLQAQADAKGLIAWEVNVDSTVCRAHQHAAGAATMGDLQKAPPGGIAVEPADHGLGRSRGGLTTKIHLAVEQGQKSLSFVITAGQRGDSPQFEPVLEAIWVPGSDQVGHANDRTGSVPTKPTTPVRTEPSYAGTASRRRSRSLRIGSATARSSAPAVAARRSSTRSTTASAMRSSAGSIASSATGLWLRDTKSWPSAMRRPCWSQSSMSGCDQYFRNNL